MQHHPVATALATAIAHRDPSLLEPALTETVRLRALLPIGPIEEHGRADVAERLPAPFAGFDTVEVVESGAEDVADRLLVHYRLDVRRGPTRWVCTQTAVCRLADERLAVIDLLCSGFREVNHEDDDIAPARARLVG